MSAQRRLGSLLAERRLNSCLLVIAVCAAGLILPAAASATVYCVNDLTVPGCQVQPTVTAAFTAANSNPGSDDVKIGPGVYTQPSLQDSGSDVHVVGSGQGQTTLTTPVPLNGYVLFLSESGSSVSDLTVKIPIDGDVAGEQGLSLDNASANQVTVDGAGTDNTQAVLLNGGASFDRGSISMPQAPPIGNRGVFVTGPLNSVTRSTIVADVGMNMSAAAATFTLDRTKIFPSSVGVLVDGGNVSITNSLIDLGTFDSANALGAYNDNPGTTPKSIDARHVTIVGGGAGSIGATARSASDTASQASSIALRDSVIAGPSKSIVGEASNNGGALQPSTATITTDYSNYAPGTYTPGAHGAVDVTEAHHTTFAPGFTDAANSDYRLASTSSLVDGGDPAAPGPALDLLGGTRVIDGNGDGVQRRDIGAYELQETVAPDVTITSGPAGITAEQAPTFSFTTGESGSSFRCSVDGAGFGPCSGPGDTHTAAPLGDGPHTFAVSATDVNGNPDPTPASRTFTVDATAPETTLTSGPAEGSTVGTNTPAFGFTSSETPESFQCSVDGAGFTACDPPITTASLQEGTHSFAVRAVDAAANVDPTPASRGFTVHVTTPRDTVGVLRDTTAPSTKLGKLRINQAKRRATLAFSGSDAAGPVTFRCKLDKKAYKPCRSAQTYTKLKRGKHTIQVVAKDAAGNLDRTPARTKFRIRKGRPR
jgi:hypothetical protein